MMYMRNGQNASTQPESNVKGYTAAYKTCSSLYHKVFRDLKLVDLQTVIDTCGKNYPTLRKIKVLFNQLYDFAIKNDICNKDCSIFVDVVQYKDRNPNMHFHVSRSRCRSDDYQEDCGALWCNDFNRESIYPP